MENRELGGGEEAALLVTTKQGSEGGRGEEGSHFLCILAIDLFCNLERGEKIFSFFASIAIDFAPKQEILACEHLDLIMDSEHVQKPDQPKPEIDPRSVDKTSCSRSSSSSISSDEEDYFQIDTSELGKSAIVSAEVPGNNFQPPFDAENAQLETGNKPEIRTPLSSDDSYSNPGSNDFPTAGANQSPPIQSMNRTDFPDPNRIPSYVFARTKSSTPMEWSVASNESLFSIHMGKSGDLTGLYSVNQFDGYPPMSPNTSPGLQQIVEAPNSEEAIAEEHAEKGKPPKVDAICHSDSTSHLSDAGSVNSFRSFAFPILTPEGRNKSCRGESVHQPIRKEQPLPQAEPEKTEPPKAESAAKQKSWLSCLPCCSFCF
ncbi:hypothetical protein Cni_G22813 [Canna indica]|uniref:Uncharacterized protein n=1 Tax=Canna indica TaxID=4628 RepID=A0AAQ3KVV1_9LILI|nr:hypothetical protein Cni_G22813 [Canna indica]